MAILFQKPIWGPAAASRLLKGPPISALKLCAFTLSHAFIRSLGAFTFEGRDEWPPGTSASSLNEAYPFSATLTMASFEQPVKLPGESTLPPSSSIIYSLVPSCLSASAIFAAPYMPPVSSSCPNAKSKVLLGTKPAANNASADSRRPRTTFLQSSAPLPQMKPSSTAPENGPCIHCPIVLSSTGTTSRCPIMSTGSSPASLPGHLRSSE